MSNAETIIATAHLTHDRAPKGAGIAVGRNERSGKFFVARTIGSSYVVLDYRATEQTARDLANIEWRADMAAIDAKVRNG